MSVFKCILLCCNNNLVSSSNTFRRRLCFSCWFVRGVIVCFRNIRSITGFNRILSKKNRAEISVIKHTALTLILKICNRHGGKPVKYNKKPLILFLIIFLTSCSAARQPKLDDIPQDIDITSVNELCSFSKEYLTKNINDSVSLYQINGDISNNKDASIQFVFVGKHVYFLDTDISDRKIKYTEQIERNRLYGRDITINIDEIDLIIDDIKNMYLQSENNIDFDSVKFYTVNNNIIVIQYFVRDEKTFTIDYDFEKKIILGYY